MSNRNFKVIIVGGSVAGLTLAHTFSRAGIDYILLESRDTISPQLGASIVIMPNGAMILDQMGLYDDMQKLATGLKRSFLRTEDGADITSNMSPQIVEQRLGYQCGLCERMIFLRYLYDQLEDQSKITLNKKVVDIEHGTGSVTVRCEDGSEFVGDLVIGADGIHSQTRKEMQRYAEEIGPPGLMEKDKNSISAEYNCVFGMSRPVSSLTPGDTHTTTALDYSTLLFTPSSGSPQWFLFSKMPQRYVGKSNIPRFTNAEMESTIQKFSSCLAAPGITVGALMESANRVGYFSLEEANHAVWSFGRIVCVGDAIHKMTPNIGQGGNQAIESAAVLTNCLWEMLRAQEGKQKKVGEEELKEALKKYQRLRQGRAKMFVNISGMVTRNEALASLRHVLKLLYEKPISGEELADIQQKLYQTAPRLGFLPLPARTLENEIWSAGMKKERRSDTVTVPKPRL